MNEPVAEERGGEGKPDRGLGGDDVVFRRQLRRITLWPIGVLVSLLLILLALLTHLVQSADRVDETARALTAIAHVERLVAEMESALRGYVLAGDQTFVPAYESARAVLPNALDEVRANLNEARRLEPVRQALSAWVEHAMAERQAVAAGIPVDPSVELKGKELMDAVRGALFGLRSETRSILAARAEVFQWGKMASFAGLVLAGLVMAPLLMVFVRGSVERLVGSYRDILGNVQRERSQLSVALRAADMGAFEWDLDEKRLHWSPELFAVFGVHPGEIKLTVERFERFILPEDRAAFWRKVDEAVGGEQVLVHEFRIVRKDGGVRWVASRADVRRSGGRGHKLTGVLWDITERRELEEKLVRAHGIQQAIFEGSSDLIYVKDDEGRMIAANPMTCRVIGKTQNELLGKTELEWGGDTPETRAIMETDRRVLATLKLQMAEEVYTGPGGARRIYHSSKTPWFGRDGRARGIIGISRDITDRKKVEDQIAQLNADLRGRVEELQRLMDVSPVGIFVAHDAHCETITMNAAGAAMLEVPLNFNPSKSGPEREVLPFRVVSDGEEVPSQDLPMQKAARTGEPVLGEEIDIVFADGRIRSLFEYAVPLFDDAGGVRGCLGVFVDISERKRAERELRESEERFRSLVSVITDVPWVCDERGRFSQPQLEWETYTGQRWEEYKGTGWLNAIHPEDREQLSALWAKAADASARYETRGRLWSAELREWRRFIAEATPVRRDDGTVREWVGTCTDVEDQKRVEEALRDSEERFRTLADNISQLAWMADATGWIFWFNKRWFDYTGTTFKEMEGWGWKRVHHPDHVDRVVEGIQRSWTAGARWEDTFPLRGHDGTFRWFLSSAVPIQDQDGRILRWFGTSTDITDLRATQGRLAELNERLMSRAEELDRLVGERTAQLQETVQQLETFSYSIVHDMRAPLRSMRSFAAFLEQDYRERLDDTGRTYLQRISRSAARMDALITDVLNYTRLGLREMPLESVDLDALIPDIIEQEPQFREKAGSIVVKRPLPRVLGNTALLTQVISNLLGNALKFVSDGHEPHVRVWSEASENEAMIRVWVEDNGIGIAEEHFGKIFGLFERLHQNSDFPGTGVGLAIVKKAVERMGGTVGLQSAVGDGSKFWFTLTRAPQDAFHTAVSAGQSAGEVA